jgi:hypothetical protein
MSRRNAPKQGGKSGIGFVRKPVGRALVADASALPDIVRRAGSVAVFAAQEFLRRIATLSNRRKKGALQHSEKASQFGLFGIGRLSVTRSKNKIAIYFQNDTSFQTKQPQNAVLYVGQ